MNIFTCVVFLIINYLIIAIIGLLNYLLSISNPKSMSLTSQTSVFNSWVRIIFEKENSKFVASKQKNLFSESTTFCYYFPQIEEVVYLELSKQKQENRTLQAYVRGIISKKGFIQKYKIDSNSPLNFYTFEEVENVIAQTSKLSFPQCSSVKVYFEIIPQGIKAAENKKILELVISPSNRYTIEINNLKMRVGQLLVVNKLKKYELNSFLVNGQIVRHYENLQKLNLNQQKYQTYPLFLFQTFYYDMHQVYNNLLKQGVQLQGLVELYTEDLKSRQILQQTYSVFPSSIDKITQATIIYISSEHFRFQEHKKYLYQYVNGKIKSLKDDKQTQIVSLMLNSLEKLPQDSHQKCIYISQEIDDCQDVTIDKDQIFRVETFTAATNSIEKLELNPDKRYLIYEIEPISARQTGKHSCDYKGFTHILLPYKQYLVTSKTTKEKNTHISLIEIPTPNYLDKSLILWITDDLSQTRSFDNKKIIPQQINYQLILFKSMKVFQIWLQKYISLTASRSFCVIYNKDNLQQAGKAIELTKKYFGDKTNILIYKSKGQFSFESLLEIQTIKLATKLYEVHNYISQSLQREESKAKRGQCCTCEVC